MPSNGLLRAELEPSQVRDRRNEAARCLIGPMTSEMDWLQWYFGPSLQAPFTAMTTLNGKPLPTDLDVQLIELIYLVVANELECAECGHLLGRGLRVRDTAIGPPPSWPVKVDTRCWGWRRHRHAAEVTRPSKDLMLGDLELRAR